MRVDGVVQGQINGTVMGEFHGLVRGEANIFVNMGKIELQTDDGSSLEALIDKNTEEGMEENIEDNVVDEGGDNDEQ
jgi:hypothetical protein